MIKIENVSVYGIMKAIHGMRNPMNSWDKSDSGEIILNLDDVELGEEPIIEFKLGPNDLKLMQSLIKTGTDHSKFMRMITVYMDITAPLYWWKEFDTYKIGTVANSCSTMHKIHSKEFTIDDFSHEHLSEDVIDKPFRDIINCLNFFRNHYNLNKDKDSWWQMIQLLPSSYNQKRTIMLNFQVLHNIYFSRKNHKLDEWRDFCRFIEDIPYGKELICYISN